MLANLFNLVMHRALVSLLYAAGVMIGSHGFFTYFLILLGFSDVNSGLVYLVGNLILHDNVNI